MIAARLRGLLHHEASTRSAGLLRIALASLALALHGGELQLFRTLDVVSLALGLTFHLFSLAMLVGVGSRLATAGTGVVLVACHHHFGLSLGRPTFTQHQGWLLASSVLLLALTPCGASYSVDRARAVVRAARAGRPAPEERGDVSGLRLMALQLSVVYLYGALHKTQLGFLSGARLQHILLERYWGSDRPEGAWFAAAALVASVSVVAVEYALSFGLWHPRLRGWLVAAGAGMHAAFHLLLPVGVFSALAVSLYLAFLPPGSVHRFLDLVHGGAPRAPRCRLSSARE